jgi:hypothetical protein
MELLDWGVAKHKYGLRSRFVQSFLPPHPYSVVLLSKSVVRRL